MKLILVGTMGRCGSTLLHRIIINILRMNNFSFVSRTDEVTDVDESVDYNIMKLHKEPNRKTMERSDYIFTCVRDFREVMASHLKYTSVNVDMKKFAFVCDYQKEYHDFWIDKSDVCFKYEDYISNGVCDYGKYIDTITDLLGIDKVDSVELESKIPPGGKHITSNKMGVNEYGNVLSEMQKKYINENHHDFLKKYNYNVE